MSTLPAKRSSATDFSAVGALKGAQAPGKRLPHDRVTIPFRPYVQESPSDQVTNPVPAVLQCFWQNVKTGAPLLVMDMVGLALGIACGTAVATLLTATSPEASLLQPQAFLTGIVFLVAYAICGLYPGVGLNPVVELKQMMLATIASGIMIQAASLSFRDYQLSDLLFIATMTCVSVIVVPTLRCISREVFSAFSWWAQPAVVIGSGSSAEQLLSGLRSKAASGLKPIGLVSERSKLDFETDEFLGDLSHLQRIARENHVFWALIPMNDAGPAALSRILPHCSSIPNLIVVPPIQEFPCLWSRTRDVGGMLGLHVRERLVNPTSQIVKRAFDLTAVICGCLLISPFLVALLAVTWLCIKIRSPGPVFYSQERVGKGGRKFRAWKFRTMVLNADQKLEKCLEENPEMKLEWESCQKLRRDPRIIPGIGNLLRKSSLDELPQLWNVLIGDMSLVGPRPFMENQEDFYGEVLPLYQKVRPGITGLWQISGRNHTTFGDRVKYDAYYVRNWSLWLDIFILGRTVRTVLFREGAF